MLLPNEKEEKIATNDNMVSPCHAIAKRRSITRNLKILACALGVCVQKPCSADWTMCTDRSSFPDQVIW